MSENKDTEKEIEKKQPEKIYSYKKMNNKMVFKQHSFKESEIDQQGFEYFCKELLLAYNKSPFAVKVYFMQTAGPQFQEYMEREETKAAIDAGLAVERGASDLGIVN